MRHRKFRLDRFISLKTGIPKSDIRLLLAQKRILLDGKIASEIHAPVDYFSEVCLDGNILQAHQPYYLMLNKPPGVLSATQDNQHSTVIDLLLSAGLDTRIAEQLHIVGRLDLNSSGLLLLSNDSQWSKRLMAPQQKIDKVYEVVLQNPVTEECIQAFSEGIYFPYENSTTLPARLVRLADRQARVTLQEGKYHQIKRMFGRFQNTVLSLHRTSIGAIHLDPQLAPGQYRLLTEAERLNAGDHGTSSHF